MEDYLKNGSETDSMKARLAPFIQQVNQIPNLTATVVQDGAGRDIYRASVKVAGEKSAKEVIAELKAENPAIYTRGIPSTMASLNLIFARLTLKSWQKLFSV